MCRQQPQSGGGLREDHNFPLPGTSDARGGRFRPKLGYGGFFRPRGGGAALPPSAVLDGTSEEVFRWEEGDHKRPHPNQAESVGASQGQGLRPAQGGQARVPHAGMTGMPREDARQARVGWRAPTRVHGRASIEKT